MPIVLAPLAPLALAFFVIALALAITYLLRHIADTVRGIRIVGGYIADKIDGMAQALSNAAGSLENGVDKLIGASWHALARYTDDLWHAIAAQSQALLVLGQHIGSHVYNVTGLRSLVHHLERVWNGIEHGVKTLTRTVHRLGRRIARLEHDLAHGIGADVLPRIRSLDRALGRVEHKTIPALRGEVATLEGDVTALGEYIRANFLSNATEAVTAAVAVALAALGLGGLRCNTLGNMMKRRGCGLWGDLESILGLLADTVLLTNICSLLPPLEAAVSEVADPLVVALTDVGAGLCSGGIGPPPTLTVPPLSLPASPGLSLNLP